MKHVYRVFLHRLVMSSEASFIGPNRTVVRRRDALLFDNPEMAVMITRLWGFTGFTVTRIAVPDEEALFPDPPVICTDPLSCTKIYRSLGENSNPATLAGITTGWLSPSNLWKVAD